VKIGLLDADHVEHLGGKTAFEMLFDERRIIVEGDDLGVGRGLLQRLRKRHRILELNVVLGLLVAGMSYGAPPKYSLNRRSRAG